MIRGIFSFCLMCFLTISAQALPLGEFQGKGSAMTLDWESPCSKIDVSLRRPSPEKLILSGGYHCGRVDKAWPKRVFRLEGDKVFWQGEEVGRYTEDLLRLLFEGGQYRIVIKRRKEGDFFFREMWANRRRFLLVEGELQRQDN